jgi:hypothetical protein
MTVYPKKERMERTAQKKAGKGKKTQIINSKQ